ncbi:alanine racemase [Fluviispira multicolorata]|uniref:Alanine racemase n=1 Tax=Fluviispira multicolorata TaxID=2654512 RepID=A0A833JFW2_9BACT|nr:alanine racemase [Fluviispira multicolorata]KAB8031826.1 alanine racemase [Fluviispira multicolorata]
MGDLAFISEFPEQASWLEISQAAFVHNVSVFRNAVESQILLGCVLKGNAYGHGFMPCLEILHGYVDLIFVISPVDAFKIRKYEKENDLTQKRVIVLGVITAEEAVRCARKVIEVVVGDEEWKQYIPILKQSEKGTGNSYRPLKAHIHIDTGLGREGFTLDNLTKKIDFLTKCTELIHIQGVMSHFSNTEDVTEQEYAFEQMAKLNEAFDIIEKKFSLNYSLEKHFAQSAASLVIPRSRYDLVRVGISMYGLWPSIETKLSAKVVLNVLPKLMPVLSWKCKSQSIKTVISGSYIGYGCTFRADRDLRTALLPVGYYDGYPRLISNKGYVLVNGLRCKILGRVMMNHIIVDVTEATGDETSVVATLIGSDGKESVSAENLAEWAQTINYEIVTRIGSHLKRLVID